jgi:hypothetical protein
VALDNGAQDLHRVVALQALSECKDEQGLSTATQKLVNGAKTLGPRLSVEAARVLYPNYLTLDQLFTLIEQLPPPDEFSTEGFGYAINDLFAAAPVAARSEFIARLRAYPGSLDSWRGICSKSPEHDTDHGEADECSDSRCVAFEVASQTTVTTDPRERSFDDPPFG